jgi:hypothetical protein
MDWHQIKQDFERDGALRDIYVLETDLTDWQRVVEYLRQTHQPLEFQVNREPRPLPGQVRQIFNLRPEGGAAKLALRVGGVLLHCHFFSDEEIEFDFWPEDVKAQAELDALLAFMVDLHRVTQKAVLLTPENYKESPIFRVDVASSKVIYMPPSDGAAV